VSRGRKLERLAPVAKEDGVRLVGDQQVDVAGAGARGSARRGHHLRHDPVPPVDDGGDSLVGERYGDGAGPRLPVAAAVIGGHGHVGRELALAAMDDGQDGRDVAGGDVADTAAVARDRRLRLQPHVGVGEHPARGVLDVAEQRSSQVGARQQGSGELEHVNERHASRVVEVDHEAWLRS
jgi:hypothetical protein